MRETRDTSDRGATVERSAHHLIITAMTRPRIILFDLSRRSRELLADGRESRRVRPLPAA
jgi:hypothetical protein